MIRKREKVRLIEDTAFMVRREKFARPKPEAWFRSGDHLDFIRGRACLACGKTVGVVAAHVRKGTDGAAKKKPSDYFTVPLCDYCHRVQHQIGEPAFWTAQLTFDPIEIALDLATRSDCHRTRAAATEERRRRYG
jgi:hypothetical protein